MYAWIWRRLPGRTLRDRVLVAAGLVAVVVLLLWFVAFPWTESHLRFDDGTVGGGTTTPSPASTPTAPATTTPRR